jgi:hypothetical protein
MSKILGTAAAIIVWGSASALATNCADQITRLRQAAQIGHLPTSGYAQLMFFADLTRAEAVDAEGDEEACLSAASSATQYLVVHEADAQ